MTGRLLSILVASAAILISGVTASVISPGLKAGNDTLPGITPRVHVRSNDTLPGITPRVHVRSNDTLPGITPRVPGGQGRQTSVCGSNPVAPGTYTLSPGQSINIASPNFPNFYPNNVLDEWEIMTSSPDDVLEIFCDIVSIKKSRRCKADKLVVQTSCETKRFCPFYGSEYAPEPCDDYVYIKFKTNRKGRSNGFCCTITNPSAGGVTTPAGPDTTTPSTDTTTEPTGTCACGVPNRSTKIVGGVVTTQYEYPWLVGVAYVGSYDPFCGGSVYNTEWVITAAHCVDGDSASSIQVNYQMWSVTSTSGVIVRGVSQIISHAQYNSNTVDNDIALLRVNSPVDLTQPGILPVCLPAPTANYEGSDAVVTGWGTLSSNGASPDKNHVVTVPIRTHSDCVSSYPLGYITNNMICAGYPTGGKDSCQGDSGGPLTVDVGGQHYLAGIVSWGFGCADPDYYGVYTDVPNYVTFIQNNVNTGTFC